jgi:hypothetical protein
MFRDGNSVKKMALQPLAAREAQTMPKVAIG